MNFSGFILPILLILILVTIIPLVIKLILKKQPTKQSFPYIKNNKLLSPAERSFYGVLNQIIEKDKIVLTKVRLADVISVKNGINRGEWQRAFNSISSKHIDFLICNTNDFSIEYAIELDDSSHSKTSRKIRDDFLNQALFASNTPFIRIKVQNSYNIDEVRKSIYNTKIK